MIWAVPETIRVRRGGSWGTVSQFAGVVAYRCDGPGFRGDYLGVRLVRRVS